MIFLLCVQLDAFLQHSLSDRTLVQNSDLVLASHLDNAPSSIKLSTAQLETMQTNIHKLIKRLTDQKFKDLLHIKNQPKYVKGERIFKKIMFFYIIELWWLMAWVNDR